MPKTYDFDAYLAEARPTPFVLKFGDEQISIDPPDSETMLLFEEAGTSRHRLKLLCGEHYERVFEQVRHRHPGVMNRFVEDLVRHFNLVPAPEGGGRASST